jgi:hypothetical protein
MTSALLNVKREAVFKELSFRVSFGNPVARMLNIPVDGLVSLRAWSSVKHGLGADEYHATSSPDGADSKVRCKSELLFASVTCVKKQIRRLNWNKDCRLAVRLTRAPKNLVVAGKWG